jgi:phosphopantetheine adenylyltransferase
MEDINMRIKAVENVFAKIKRLNVKVVPIYDGYFKIMIDFGPTKTDSSFEAIVCSFETQKGCENGIEFLFI